MGASLMSRAVVSVAAGGAVEIGPRARAGATLSQTVGPSASPITATISAAGDIAVGDTVFHDIAATAPAAATRYTVDAIGGGSITLSWTGGGSRTVTTGKILSPLNHSRGVVEVLGYQLATTVAAGTFQFLGGVNAVTGAQSLAVNSPASARSKNNAPICRSAPAEALYLGAATGALNGWVAYAQG